MHPRTLSLQPRFGCGSQLASAALSRSGTGRLSDIREPPNETLCYLIDLERVTSSPTAHLLVGISVDSSGFHAASRARWHADADLDYAELLRAIAQVNRTQLVVRIGGYCTAVTLLLEGLT